MDRITADHAGKFRSMDGLSPPPTTRFATEFDADGIPNISTIDWMKVVTDEPHHVANWLLYLHRTQDMADLSSFMDALLKGLADGHERPQKWDAFTAAAVPCVVMDIAIGSDMYELGGDGDQARVFKVRLIPFKLSDVI